MVVSASVSLTLSSGTTKETALLFDLPPLADRDEAKDASYPLAALLTYGAGGDMRSGNLDALAAALAQGGVPCVRFECKGPSFPHRYAVAVALLAAIDAGRVSQLRRPGAWLVVGQSLGARVSAALATSHAGRVAGAALLSYPLQPPQTQKSAPEDRVALLLSVRTPALLVRGTRDVYTPGAALDPLLAQLQAANPRVSVLSVEDGDHSLAVRGGAGKKAAALDAVCTALVAFAQQLLP